MLKAFTNALDASKLSDDIRLPMPKGRAALPAAVNKLPSSTTSPPYWLTNPLTKPKTLFATHYHELNELEEKLEGVKNYHIAVRERGQNIVFLRTLEPGGSEHSFGIQVAQLAGIPTPVLDRARKKLSQLEQDDRQTSSLSGSGETRQAELFMPQTQHPAVNLLEEINADELSPKQALDMLYRLQDLMKS